MKIKSRIIILLFFYNLTTFLAFDNTFMVNKDAFVYEKYNFLITKVIDARINKTLPVGFYRDMFGKTRTVGNDSLDKELIRYFNKYTKPFYEPTKMILVINQINLLEIRNNDGIEVELTLALDYYRITDNKAKLEYSQYTKTSKSVVAGMTSAINKLFSETMAAAFLQFKNQIMYYKPIEIKPIMMEELQVKLNAPIVKRIDKLSMNEGVYFNINQLLKNAPVLSLNYKIISDSALLKQQNITFESKTYLFKKAFAFVTNNQLYIYIGDGIYLPAVFEDEKIVLRDIYYQKKNKMFNNKVLAGLRPFMPLLAIISDVSNLSGKTEVVKIYINEETGELKI